MSKQFMLRVGVIMGAVLLLMLIGTLFGLAGCHGRGRFYSAAAPVGAAAA